MKRTRGLVLAITVAACSQAVTERPSNPGGYQDLEVPSRWGDYPLAGALARLGGTAGLDWVDHLTNCGLSDEWIEEMRAAWWSEREYTVASMLEARIRVPFGNLGRLERRAETVRIRYGKIGGETTVEERPSTRSPRAVGSDSRDLPFAHRSRYLLDRRGHLR